MTKETANILKLIVLSAVGGTLVKDHEEILDIIEKHTDTD